MMDLFPCGEEATISYLFCKLCLLPNTMNVSLVIIIY